MILETPIVVRHREVAELTVSPRMFSLFFVLPLLTSIGSQATARTVQSETWRGSIHRTAEAYAESAELTLLRDGDAPELRVWIEDVMSGDVVGHVITANGATNYVLHVAVDQRGVVTVTSLGKSQLQPGRTSASLQDLLSKLQALDGQDWACAVDGESTTVEGVASGKRFAFHASNSWLCHDDRSTLLRRMLDVTGPWD